MTLSSYLDRIAILLSTVCIVHCLAVPLLIAVLPLAALSIGSDSHFHSLMLWLVVPTSAIGFALGYRVHRRVAVVVLGAAAVSVLAVGAAYGHTAWEPTAETFVNVLASLALAAAHWLNFTGVRRVHRHV